MPLYCMQIHWSGSGSMHSTLFYTFRLTDLQSEYTHVFWNVIVSLPFYSPCKRGWKFCCLPFHHVVSPTLAMISLLHKLLFLTGGYCWYGELLLFPVLRNCFLCSGWFCITFGPNFIKEMWFIDCSYTVLHVIVTCTSQSASWDGLCYKTAKGMLE